MNSTETEFIRLQSLAANASLMTEGGNPIVLLPQFSFRSGSQDQTMDLLLYPSNHTGYPTRLFFQGVIQGKGRNWTQHRIADRNWWAPSYTNVRPDLPWTAILCEHLRAVA